MNFKSIMKVRSHNYHYPTNTLRRMDNHTNITKQKVRKVNKKLQLSQIFPILGFSNLKKQKTIHIFANPLPRIFSINHQNQKEAPPEK